MNPLELNLGIVGIITIVVISHLSTKIRYLQENFEKLKRKVDELERRKKTKEYLLEHYGDDKDRT